jgi:hypothetical protein
MNNQEIAAHVKTIVDEITKGEAQTPASIAIAAALVSVGTNLLQNINDIVLNAGHPLVVADRGNPYPPGL